MGVKLRTFRGRVWVHGQGCFTEDVAELLDWLAGGRIKSNCTGGSTQEPDANVERRYSVASMHRGSHDGT